MFPGPEPAPCSTRSLSHPEMVALQGKTLTTSIKQIFGDFQAAAEKFKNLGYDAMNVDAKQFDIDFFAFRSVINELERRLGAVIVQASAASPAGTCGGCGLASCVLNSFIAGKCSGGCHCTGYEGEALPYLSWLVEKLYLFCSAIHVSCK